MASTTLSTRIVLKGDTAENWAASTLVLLKNEVGIESDTLKLKIGNGTDVYSDLSYINMTPEEVSELVEAAEYTLPTASSTTLGGVKIGSNISISSGTISVASGTTSTVGVVKLNSSTSSTSTTTAATPSAVKSAYDLANTANTAAADAQSTADSKIGSVTLASGTNNGTLKLTVDGTATDNIAVTGLGSAAYTASTAYATAAQGTLASNAMPKSGGTFTGAVTLKADPTTDLGAATKQYVDNAVTDGIATSDAMVFKGTLGTDGTVTAVPTTDIVQGDTYKIITAGTYAGSSCKVGDLLIATASGDLTADSTNWAYVPSGNENETTIKYSTSTTNLTTSAKTGAITLGAASIKQVDTSISDGSSSTNLPTSAAVAAFVEGKGYSTTTGTITGITTTSPLSGSGTSGSVALSHAASGATAGSYGDSAAQTPAYGGTFKVPYVTVNATGHVTGISAHTVTIPASDNTDTKVTQTSSTSTSAFPLLASVSSAPTSGTATTAIYNTGVTVTPSTGTVTATTFSGDLDGNATTASTLETSRTIRTNLASTSTASFNGSANITPGVTGILKVANGGTGTSTGHIAITAGTDTTSTESPAHGGTFTAIDSVTKDDYGHVTAVNTKTITLPADNNTDTKVTQTVTTTSSSYPVLLAYTASQTATTTNTARFGTGVSVNPSTSTVTATTFSGALSGNASTATTLKTARTIAISDGATGTATSFNGSANITIPVTALNTDYLINGSNTLVLDGGDSAS